MKNIVYHQLKGRFQSNMIYTSDEFMAQAFNFYKYPLQYFIRKFCNKLIRQKPSIPTFIL